MKTDRLIPGTILVCIGAIFLLHNFHIFHFQWMNILYLWPIFLIIGGVNLVFAGNRSPLATVVKLAVIIGGFSLLLFGNFGNRYHFWPSTFINFDDDHDDSDTTNIDHGVTKIKGNSVFNTDYTTDVKLARLNINGGATSYTLEDTTDKLFTAETQEFYSQYLFNTSKNDSVTVLNLKMKDTNNINFDSNNKKSNTADIRLNVNPIWDIHVQAGAARVNFDLSKFKIKNVTLEGAAASFDVKLGEPFATTTVEISNAASKVEISIPETAACKISSSGFLLSDDFDGFIKKEDNDFETADYATAKNKIIIHMTGIASGFKVNRY